MSIPATAPASSSIPRRNTSGRSRLIARASSTSAPANRGEIFRVDRSGNGSLFFKSDEAQIRALGLRPISATFIAGTDGSGLIYRISAQGKGFRFSYSAPKKEINRPRRRSAGEYLCRLAAGEKRGGSAAHRHSRRRRRHRHDASNARDRSNPSFRVCCGAHHQRGSQHRQPWRL